MTRKKKSTANKASIEDTASTAESKLEAAAKEKAKPNLNLIDLIQLMGNVSFQLRENEINGKKSIVDYKKILSEYAAILVKCDMNTKFTDEYSSKTKYPVLYFFLDSYRFYALDAILNHMAEKWGKGLGKKLNEMVDSEGDPIPYHACTYNAKEDRKEAVARLLKIEGIDLNKCGTNPLKTPLMASTMHPTPILFEKLIEKGADVNQGTDKHNTSILTILCRNRKLDFIKILIAKGANVNQVGVDGLTAIMVVCEPVKRDSFETKTKTKTKTQNLIIDLLIKSNADLSLVKDDTTTLLMFACHFAGQREELIERLLKCQVVKDSINRQDKLGRTALHYACEPGNEGIVKLLLTAGINTSLCGADRYIALHFACMQGNAKIAHKLIDADKDLTDVTLPNRFGSTALISCFIYMLNLPWEEIGISEEEYKLKYADELTQRESNLTEMLLVIQKLISVFKDDTARKAYLNQGDKDGKTAICYAIQTQNMPLISILLKCGADLKHICKDGTTPLMWACETNTEIVQSILKKLHDDASIELTSALDDLSKAREQALVDASTEELKLAVNSDFDARKQALSVASTNKLKQYLNIQTKAPATIRSEGPGIAPATIQSEGPGTAPATIQPEGPETGPETIQSESPETGPETIQSKDPKINNQSAPRKKPKARRKKSKAQKTIQSIDQETALSIACRYGDEPMAILLIAAGADISIANQNGDSAFFIACRRGMETVVQIMLDQDKEKNKENNKVNIDHQDSDANTALIKEVSTNDHEGVVPLPPNDGAMVNLKNKLGVSPLANACIFQHASVVKLLLAAGANPDDQDSIGNTALLHAVANGNDTIVELLLAVKANPNLANTDKITPLWQAIESQNLEIVKLLIKHRADIHQKYANDETVLFTACRLGLYNIVEKLCESGADINHLNAEGKTPLHVTLSAATPENQPEMLKLIKILLDKGADIYTVISKACKLIEIPVLNVVADLIEDKLLEDKLLEDKLLEDKLLEDKLLKDKLLKNKYINADSILTKAYHNNDAGVILYFIKYKLIESGKIFLQACRESKIDYIKLIIQNARDLSKENITTALNQACKDGQFEVVKAILEEKNFEVIIGSLEVSQAYKTALLNACHDNEIEIVEYILSNYKGNMDDIITKSSLQLACKNGNTEIIKLFFTYPLSNKKKLIKEALPVALTNNQFGAISTLIALDYVSGYIENTINQETLLFALTNAYKNKQLKVLKHLIDNYSASTPIIIAQLLKLAYQNKDIGIIEFLSKEYQVDINHLNNYRDKDPKETLLHFICRQDQKSIEKNIEFIRSLLAACKGELNTKNSAGKTPLEVAFEVALVSKNTSMVSLLARDFTVSVSEEFAQQLAKLLGVDKDSIENTFNVIRENNDTAKLKSHSDITRRVTPKSTPKLGSKSAPGIFNNTNNTDPIISTDECTWANGRITIKDVIPIQINGKDSNQYLYIPENFKEKIDVAFKEIIKTPKFAAAKNEAGIKPIKGKLPKATIVDEEGTIICSSNEYFEIKQTHKHFLWRYFLVRFSSGSGSEPEVKKPGSDGKKMADNQGTLYMLFMDPEDKLQAKGLHKSVSVTALTDSLRNKENWGVTWQVTLPAKPSSTNKPQVGK